MSTSSATLPHRDASAGSRPDHRPLSAIAAAAGGGVPQARIRRVLADLAAPLAQLHAQGRVHGAIAMNTVGLDASGKAHLLVPPLEPAADAEGGVRLAGYAAFEQYTDDPERPCGPWTDIYALSAVAHAMLVGAAPPDALARCVKDTYEPLAGRELGAYDPDFLRAVDRGLSMTPAARAQDMDAFGQAFGLGLMAPSAAVEPPAAEPDAAPELPPVAAPAVPEAGPRVPLLVMLGVLAAVALAVYLWLRPNLPAPQPADSGVPPAPAPAPAPAQPQAPVPTPPALSDLGAGRPADRANPPADAPPAAAPQAGGPDVPPPGVPDSAAPPVPTAPAPGAPGAEPPADTPPVPGQAPQAATPPTVPGATPAPSEAPPPSPAVPAPGSATSGPAGTEAPGTPPGAAPPAGPDAAGNAPAGANPAVPGATAVPGAPGEPAVPEEAPPTTSVAVRVHVQPWGEVLVDGRSRGISPPLTELTLSPGRHRVTIRNPAAPDYQTTISVDPGGSASISHVFE